MSITRGAIGYLCFVVLPVIGLLGVLRAGELIKAPINVDGAWSLALGTSQNTRLSFPAGTAPALKVSQSGIFLALALNDTHNDALSGELENGQLRAASPCWLLVSSSVSAGNITGTLRPNHCPSCPAIPFQATRISKTP